MTRGWRIEGEKRNKNVIYEFQTPFIKYLEDLRRINICPEARNYYEEKSKENPTIELGKMFYKHPPKEGWAMSMLIIYDGQLNEEIKILYFNCIQNDMMSYLLWKQLKNLSNLEREMLREKFRGKLPNIEKNLNGDNK